MFSSDLVRILTFWRSHLIQYLVKMEVMRLKIIQIVMVIFQRYKHKPVSNFILLMCFVRLTDQDFETCSQDCNANDGNGANVEGIL